MCRELDQKIGRQVSDIKNSLNPTARIVCLTGYTGLDKTVKESALHDLDKLFISNSLHVVLSSVYPLFSQKGFSRPEHAVFQLDSAAILVHRCA